jgi:hypothetical protein
LGKYLNRQIYVFGNFYVFWNLGIFGIWNNYLANLENFETWENIWVARYVYLEILRIQKFGNIWDLE